jgi:hypothetical protein
MNISSSKSFLLPFLLILIVLFSSMFTACGNDDKKTPVLEYGAEMRLNKIAVGKTASDGTEIKVPVLFDRRFLDEKEQTSIAKYFYSIQYNDIDTFKEVMLPSFEAYMQAYAEDPTITIGDVLQVQYMSALALVPETDENYGVSFKFQEIEVTDFDKKSLNDELFKISEFHSAYNTQQNLPQQAITAQNTKTMVIYARVGAKYIEANIYLIDINGKTYVMTIS